MPSPWSCFCWPLGRAYYTAGLYPVLIALGASRLVRLESLSDFLTANFWKSLPVKMRAFYISLAVLGLFFIGIILPFTPVNSAWWRFDADINAELREEIGWPELVNEVARIYSSLPAEERTRTGILVGNYGEAGAINLYGPALGLPPVISNNNTLLAARLPATAARDADPSRADSTFQ